MDTNIPSTFKALEQIVTIAREAKLTLADITWLTHRLNTDASARHQANAFVTQRPLRNNPPTEGR